MLAKKMKKSYLKFWSIDMFKTAFNKNQSIIYKRAKNILMYSFVCYFNVFLHHHHDDHERSSCNNRTGWMQKKWVTGRIMNLLGQPANWGPLAIVSLSSQQPKRVSLQPVITITEKRQQKDNHSHAHAIK